MFFTKKPKTKTEEEEPCKVLVRQDPRTTVKTTTAQTKTTSTTQQSSTIISRDQITLRTTQQTVIHEQTAGVSVIDSRRTLTEQELKEFLEQTAQKSFRDTDRINGISPNGLLQTTKYESPSQRTKTNSSWDSYKFDKPTTTPVTLKLQETQITQTEGRTMKSQLNQQKVKLEGLSPFKVSSPKSVSTDARLVQPSAVTNTIYRSPYLSNGFATNSSKSTGAIPKQPTAATPSNRFKLSSPKSVSADARPTLPVVTNTPYRSPYLSNGVATNSSKSTGTIPKQLSAATPSNRLNKGKPGKMYILNHNKFDPSDTKDLAPRYGTKEDVAALEDTFKRYGLTIKTQHDLTVNEIEKMAENIRKKNFKDYSCLVVVILTHGTRDNVVCARNGSYNIIDTLLSPILRNPSLTDKPKIFIIQACKGPWESIKLEKDAQVSYQPPSEVLMCYSTFEGYVAYRTDYGSDFIQSLCRHIKDLGAEKDVESIVKMVIAEVKKLSEGKQVPSITTTMTKTYTFGDYN